MPSVASEEIIYNNYTQGQTSGMGSIFLTWLNTGSHMIKLKSLLSPPQQWGENPATTFSRWSRYRSGGMSKYES
jgi:hypothetical protein